MSITLTVVSSYLLVELQGIEASQSPIAADSSSMILLDYGGAALSKFDLTGTLTDGSLSPPFGTQVTGVAWYGGNTIYTSRENGQIQAATWSGGDTFGTVTSATIHIGGSSTADLYGILRDGTDLWIVADPTQIVRVPITALDALGSVYDVPSGDTYSVSSLISALKDSTDPLGNICKVGTRWFIPSRDSNPSAIFVFNATFTTVEKVVIPGLNMALYGLAYDGSFLYARGESFANPVIHKLQIGDNTASGTTYTVNATFPLPTLATGQAGNLSAQFYDTSHAAVGNAVGSTFTESNATGWYSLTCQSPGSASYLLELKLSGSVISPVLPISPPSFDAASNTTLDNTLTVAQANNRSS